MNLPIVLITHFYNESLLLPFFVRSWLPLVDHAICINHGPSTDNSVNIIKDLAPNWEIRNSKLLDFNAIDNDLEVMEVEKDVDFVYPGCWKFVANITETILTPDLKLFLNEVHANDFCISFDNIVMVENEMTKVNTLNMGKPLSVQKFFGYVDRSEKTRRRRFIHRYQTGAYQVGRHGTWHSFSYQPNLLLQWWGFCPYPAVKERKLQIQTRIPQSDKDKSMGKEHIINEKELDQEYNRQASLSYDLRSDITYNSNLILLEKLY